MGVLGLLNQTITLYTKSSFDAYGRAVVGSGTDYQARIQPVSKTKLLPNGDVLTIDAICYVKAGLTINLNDRVDFNSVSYRVYSKSEAIDGSGATNHIKLELIKYKPK